MNNKINDWIIKKNYIVFRTIKNAFDTFIFRRNKIQCRFYGENISDTMSILWRNSGREGGRRVNDFSSGNKGTLWVKQDKDLWRERDLILPESRRKLSIMGKMKREWESLLSSLINRNIARFDQFKLTGSPSPIRIMKEEHVSHVSYF